MKIPGLALSLAVAGFALIIPEDGGGRAHQRIVRFDPYGSCGTVLHLQAILPLRNALAGSMLLGICCGLMGAFLVVRKLSLLGDALSHAVLPGVALGFLWNMSKDPLAILSGRRWRVCSERDRPALARDHQDTKRMPPWALCLLPSSAWDLPLHDDPEPPGGNKSGLDKFMFGQAAALGRGDVILLGVVTALALGAVVVSFYKEYTITSFDAGFARSLGMPVQIFHYSLMLLLAFAIVSSLQAVGVVLVSAMLVIPAAAAFLLTDRLSGQC